MRYSAIEPIAYLYAIPDIPLGKLEAAFHLIITVAPLEKRIADAVKEGKLTSLTLLDQIKEAKSQELLTAEEAKELKTAEMARQHVIAVDDFDDSELRRATDV